MTRMTASTLTAVFRRRLHQSRLLQVAILLGFWGAGEGIARALRLPVPGGIVGLFVVLGLLATKRVSLVSVRRGAGALLGEMLLFFIPAVLAISEHPEFLGWMGVKLVGAVLVGTATVMLVTGLSVDACYRLLVSRSGDPRDGVE